MTRILIENTTILTLDNADTFYYPGFVDIRDDKIYAIGASSSNGAVDGYSGETIRIDGTDKMVMPGLVDLHFHTAVAKVSLLCLYLDSALTDTYRDTTTAFRYGNIWTPSGTRRFGL